MKKKRIFTGRTTQLPPRAVLNAVEVNWTCICGLNQDMLGPTISCSGGGCTGHNDGEYCYCPYPEATITVTCKSEACRHVEGFVF